MALKPRKSFLKAIPVSKRTVQLTSENRIIQALQNHYGTKNPPVIKGIGDDAAVIHPRRSQEYWIVTTDMLLENVDFRREWMTPRQLGHKSLAVNLSDLAAMGVRPRFYTVSLALPSDLSENWIMSFYAGLTELGSSHKAILIGGDLSHSDSGILISIAAIGESLKQRVVYRSGGQAGDLLYVTGVLGKSAAGLRLLQDGCAHSRSRFQREALNSHRGPEPRCNVGIWLAQSSLVSCMMDLSDGLSVDLPRLCAASGIGAEIYSSHLPIFPESASWGCDPLDAALHGGEDFELLFAVPRRKVHQFEKTYPSYFPNVTQIGELTRNVGAVRIGEPGKDSRPLPERGYDHFRR